MAKTKATAAKTRRKLTPRASKMPLRAKICGVRSDKSRMTLWRDKNRPATKNEVLVAKAIAALRKKHPRKKHFGRKKVHDHLKGKLSMKAVARLLSPKRGRVFEGRDRVYPESVKQYWKSLSHMSMTEIIEHSQNSNCRVSRKADWR